MLTIRACITGGFLLLSSFAFAQKIGSPAPIRITPFNPQQKLPLYQKMVAASGLAPSQTNIQADKVIQLTVAAPYVDGSWMLLRKVKKDGNDVVWPAIDATGRSYIEVWNGKGTSDVFLEVSLKTTPGKNYLVMLNASAFDPQEPKWILSGDVQSETKVLPEQGIFLPAVGTRTTFSLRFKGKNGSMAAHLDSIELVPVD